MTLYSTELADYFAAHHSIVSTAALRRLQIKKAERERLLRAGVIEVVYEGVYRLCGAPTTFESRCAALCAADPKLTITCASSCRLAGVRGCTSDTIHAITSRRGLPIKIKGDDDVVIHRTTNLPKAHVVRRADGIRLTKTARAILDEARHREPLQLESLVEDGISKGKCTAQTLRAMVSEMAARGRRGTTRLTEVLRGRPTWRRPVGSNPELVLLKALADAGLELTRQPSLSLPDGRTIHPDGGDEEIRFFVEVDDHEWHGGRVRRTRDYVRDRQAGLGGAQVVRVGTDEIADRLDDVVAEVVGLHALRRRHVLGPDAA